MAKVPIESILFWWRPTLSELRYRWPELPENDAIAAIEHGEFVLAVLDEPDLPVWIMKP